MGEEFLINQRFIVNTVLNNLTDKETGKETRLEQRLMDVLFLLASNNNKLVTREQIIKEVWDDYGGAGEALNQAVSFLRKVLGDNNKEMIETIPKKGYILHAGINDVLEKEEFIEKINTIHKPRKRKLYFIAVLICLIGLVAYFVYIANSNKKTTNPDVLPAYKQAAGADVIKDSVSQNADIFNNRKAAEANVIKDSVSQNADVLNSKKAAHDSADANVYK